MANSVDPDQTAQSILGPCCLLLYLIRREVRAIICSRRLQQTTFSDALFLALLGLKQFKGYFQISGSCQSVTFVCFVALRPKSTAMVIAGRSVHLTTLFSGQA